MNDDPMGLNAKDFGGSLFKGMRKMQESVERWQKEIHASEFVGNAGGGMVRVVMTGDHRVQSVAIDPSLLGDREMLQDLVAAAVSAALQKREDAVNEKIRRAAPGFLGGMF